MADSQQKQIIYRLNNYVDFNKVHDDAYISSLGLIKMKKTENYFILKYKKDELNASNYNTLGLFRSVIIKDGKVVCFSPQKSLPVSLIIDDTFTKQDQFHYEEYIEGTMVNLYYDGDEWEVATRSSIGAKTNFYNGTNTFRYLFLDALNQYNFTFEDLDKSKIYSFVLQHPQNRIVKKVHTPKLCLCAVYSVLEDGTSVKEENVNGQIEEPTLSTPTNLSELFTINNYGSLMSFSDAKDLYANNSKSPYDVTGFVIKFLDGTRSKVRNPVYEEVRRLRGNQAKKQYQYYSLRKTGKIAEYLKFYPEDSKDFNKYRIQLHTYTNSLFQHYINCFVKKQFNLHEATFQYKTHMYKLHEKYINELFPQGKYVTKQVVVQYMNELDPAQQMFCVNYNLRKSGVQDK